MNVNGINHVAVTVRDLQVSGPWYRALFGTEPVLDEHTDAGFHHLVWAFGDGTLFGIHQHDRRAGETDFSELEPGLDHVGFRLRRPGRTRAVGGPPRRARRLARRYRRCRLRVGAEFP